jgi:hypothetical protein
MITYSSPGFGGTSSLCNDSADAENLRRAFANGSSVTEFRAGPLLGLVPLKDWDCRFAECHNTAVGCLCADVEQFRAGEADDVLEDRRRHSGGFRINRDSPLPAELAVVIFLLQRVTGVLTRRHKKWTPC